MNKGPGWKNQIEKRNGRGEGYMDDRMEGGREREGAISSLLVLLSSERERERTERAR